MKVLIIGYVWPEPTSSAAGIRDMELIDVFRQAGWEVHFASASQENDFSRKLANQGVVTHVIQANDPGFDSWINGLAPDYVIFDRFVTEEQFGWRVRENSPDSVRIIDTQDLHSLRRARAKALEEGKSLDAIAKAEIDLLTDDLLRELAAIYRSDLSLILSDFEYELLIQRFKVPVSILCVSRFGYPQRVKALPGFDERKNLVMIGNFRHPPNRDGILWLRQELWPEIRKVLPDVEVHIYGAYPPREMMALDDPRMGFRIKGWAEDQYATLQMYRVSLAPLRFGAGIKGKISDSWWSGTPVVTTSIGAEGMAGDLGWGGAVARSAEEFAKAVKGLYEDPGEWLQAQSRGYMILDQRFDRLKLAADLTETMKSVRANLARRREQNLIGSILQHQLNQGTKYFSRWIELKEALKKS